MKYISKILLITSIIFHFNLNISEAYSIGNLTSTYTDKITKSELELLYDSRFGYSLMISLNSNSCIYYLDSSLPPHIEINGVVYQHMAKSVDAFKSYITGSTSTSELYLQNITPAIIQALSNAKTISIVVYSKNNKPLNIDLSSDIVDEWRTLTLMTLNNKNS